MFVRSEFFDLAEGRLTLEEFGERVDLAYAARTDVELSCLVRDLPERRGVAPPLNADVEEHKAFCSHLVRQGRWSLPSRSVWRSVLGTIDLDLRQARLVSSEVMLEVFNLFGTLTVIVPEGVEVVVRGGGLFASQKIDSPVRAQIPGGPD